MVQIEAYPPPKFSWFVNGRPVLPSQRFKINYENGLITLIIFNVQPEDSGDYLLKASNEVGECTWKTTLNVKRKYWNRDLSKISKQSLTLNKFFQIRQQAGSARVFMKE